MRLRPIGVLLVVVGIPALCLGFLGVFLAGGQKEYDRCLYRSSSELRQLLGDDMRATEGPVLSHGSFPPGVVCTYPLKDGTEYVMGPSWVPIWLLGIGVVGVGPGTAMLVRARTTR